MIRNDFSPDFYEAEVLNITPLLWKQRLDTKTWLKNSRNYDSVHFLLSNANFEIQTGKREKKGEKKLIADFKMIITKPIYPFTSVLLKIFIHSPIVKLVF